MKHKTRVEVTLQKLDTINWILILDLNNVLLDCMYTVIIMSGAVS